jgi:O-antigen ligase
MFIAITFFSIKSKLIVLAVLLLLLTVGMLSNKKTEQVDISSGRLYLWVQSVEYIIENPLKGIGFGQFSSHYYDGLEANGSIELLGATSYAPGQSKERIHTHNAFLQVGVETGIIGLIIYISILWRLLIRIDRSPIRVDLKRTLRISLFATIFIGMFSGSGGLYSIEFWVTVAILEGIAKASPDRIKKADRLEQHVCLA